MYLVLEGMDGCGKTYTATALVKAMSELGMDVLHVHEPYKHEGLGVLRDYITQTDASDMSKGIVALAGRIELFKKVIEPALKEGKIVISERNFVSTLVYQGGDNPYPLLDLHETAFEQFKLDMHPDVLVKLEVDHGTFLERLKARGGPEDLIEHTLQDKSKFYEMSDRYDRAIKLATVNTKTKIIGVGELKQLYNFM